jgi:hypothetical protein
LNWDDPAVSSTISSFETDAGAEASAAILRWSARALVGVSWISAILFGLYIFAFYVGAISDGDLDQWNTHLPHLYDRHEMLATIGIATHFATGAILLLLGPVQLIGAVRRRVPRLHRWIGWLYAGTAFVTGLGGLVFIAREGTIGGVPMNLGFTLYGTLVVAAAVMAPWRARQRRFDAHRAWAIRLFALAIGSWLYRMDYGFWSMVAGKAGHTHDFRGPFDIVMSFFFYIPNLVVAEIFIRAERLRADARAHLAAALALTCATLFLAVATYYFTVGYWAPPIIHRIAGIFAAI